MTRLGAMTSRRTSVSDGRSSPDSRSARVGWAGSGEMEIGTRGRGGARQLLDQLDALAGSVQTIPGHLVQQLDEQRELRLGQFDGVCRFDVSSPQARR